MNVLFSPNPYGSEVTIAGAAIASDDPEGKEFYIKTERENFYISSPTMPPTYEIQYGSGWAPKDAEVRGTFTGQGYGRIAAYIDYSNTMTALEYDGSNTWGINLDGGIIGIKNGNFENVSFGKWDAEKIIKTYHQDGTITTTTDTITDLRTADATCYPGVAMSNIAPRCDARIETNIPLFLTQAQAQEYCRSGDTTGILNGDVPVTPNDYDYYMYNRISTTVGAGWDIENLFRYKMNTGEKLAFYMSSSLGYEEYDRVLIGSDEIAQSYKGDFYGQDPFPDSNEVAMRALGEQRKMQSGTTYTPVMYETNIPTFDTYAHALDYINTGDETGMLDKWRTDEVQPGEIGDPTDQTEQGENGAVFSYGGGMFRLINAQLASFYAEAFNTDPNVMQSILDGLQLFGSNQINCIHDVMYIPFSADDVATLSSGSDIYLGSYKMTTVQGDRVLKNDKLINMGTHYFAPPYGAGDHRNYSPLCRIFVMLPYAGTHELQIDKYIGKNITIKLAVDLTTGAGTYFIFSNNTIMDSFDCQIGAHRPITAVDHAQQVSAVTNAILQTGTQGIKTVAGATNAINPAQAATAGREATKTSLNAAGLGGVVGGAIGTVVTGYQGMQSTIDYPMTERGSFNGFLGMFDVKSPYFVFCQMETKQAQNLIAVKGKPSAAGGKLSSFSGYFEAAAVDLPTFSGTEAEAEELMSILKGGIYID